MFAVASCSSGPPTRLTETDWTNGVQPCSENRLSFRDGRIAYYPRGSEPLVMFQIDEIKPDDRDPAITTVTILPTDAIVAEARRRGKEMPPGFRAYLRLWADNGKLALVGMASTLDPEFRPPNRQQGGVFHLVSCEKA